MKPFFVYIYYARLYRIVNCQVKMPMKIFLRPLLFIGIILFGLSGIYNSNLVAGNTSFNFDNDKVFTEDIKKEEIFELSNAYPNPAITYTKLDYKVPQEVLEAKIILRSLLGSIVKEFVLDDLTGTLKIQTDDLSGGIYFYSLKLDKKIVVTRKLIIKH